MLVGFGLHMSSSPAVSSMALASHPVCCSHSTTQN